jgi:hypothetical protein
VNLSFDACVWVLLDLPINGWCSVLQRLPKDADSLREFTAEFYHSPIAPLQRQVDEIEGVAVASLQMIRSGKSRGNHNV